MATSNAVALRPKPRLPKPAYIQVNDDLWDIAINQLWPTATDPNVVAQALTLCRVRGLDPYRKPYHISKMWNSLAGREVEQVMPGINELLVTASRTGEFAGNDPPIHGKPVTETFHGRRRTKDGWQDAEITLTYPETTEVVVYRLVKGQRCAFSMPVRWKEEYQRVGGSPLPNDMWSRRVYDQCQKVALAASLRVGFSDVVEPEPDDLSVAPRPGEAEVEQDTAPRPPTQAIEPPQQPEVPHDPETGEVGPHQIKFIDSDGGEPETWQQWGARMIAAVQSATSEDEIGQWCALNAEQFEAFKKEAPVVFGRLDAAINKHRNKIKTAQASKPEKGE